MEELKKTVEIKENEVEVLKNELQQAVKTLEEKMEQAENAETKGLRIELAAMREELQKILEENDELKSKMDVDNFEKGKSLSSKQDVIPEVLEYHQNQLDVLKNDMKRLENENMMWQTRAESLERILNERKVLEEEAFKQYKKEIDKFKTTWIPISKHEEIVNAELAMRQAELLSLSASNSAY